MWIGRSMLYEGRSQSCLIKRPDWDQDYGHGGLHPTDRMDIHRRCHHPLGYRLRQVYIQDILRQQHLRRLLRRLQTLIDNSVIYFLCAIFWTLESDKYLFDNV